MSASEKAPHFRLAVNLRTTEEFVTSKLFSCGTKMSFWATFQPIKPTNEVCVSGTPFLCLFQFAMNPHIIEAFGMSKFLSHRIKL